jgi:DNA primase
LVARGYRLEDLHRAGLVVEREGGGYYDRFRDRLVFPIHHLEGEILGFGGRVLGEGSPKYLNSPQTPLFDKSATLYGLYHAKRVIREEELAILVEGYMDVLAAHQAGYRNVVASLGTALTEAHLRLLRRYTSRLTLALDADLAGREATRRGLEVAREALGDQVMSVPSPIGLIRYSGSPDAEIEVLTLPPEKDPDEIIRESPTLWRKLLEEARPLMEWYFEHMAEGCDLATARGKSQLAHRLLPMVAGIEDEVTRDHYLTRLADVVKVDKRALWARWKQQARPRRRAVGKRREDEVESILQGTNPEANVAEFCLGLLVGEPSLLAAAQEVDLHLDDFIRTDDQELLKLLRQYVEAEGDEGLDGEGFRAFVEGEWLQNRLDELQGLGHLSIEREAAQKEFLRLRKLSRWRKLTELRLLLDEAAVAGDEAEMASLQKAVRRAAEDYYQIYQMQYHRRLIRRGVEEDPLRF